MKVGHEYRINLLRYQEEAEQEAKDNVFFLGVLALILLLFVGSLGGVWWMQKGKLQAVKAENQILQEEAEEWSKSVTTIDDTSTSEADIEDIRMTMVNDLEEEAKETSKYIEDIYLLSIPSVTIGKVNIKTDNSMNITAYCQGQTRFIKYLEEVKGLDFIEEVKSISSRNNAETGEVNFNITLLLKGEIE